MAIRFIIDSASDISFAEASRLGIDMISIGVTVDGKSYKDGEDIDLKYLAREMKAGKDVKTAQPTYQQLYDAFIKYAETDDEVIFFAFSSGISGTYQSAVMVANEIKEDYPDYKITIVDTKIVLSSIHIFILDAIYLRDKGAGVELILNYLEKYRESALIYVTAQDLYYLVKGGRLSNSGAVIGNILDIKPILTMVDGDLISIGKTRGMKKYYKNFVQEMKTRLKNVKDISKVSVTICHFENYEGVSEFKSIIEKHLGISKFTVNNMSVAVGAHLGPGSIGGFYSPLETEQYFGTNN